MLSLFTALTIYLMRVLNVDFLMNQDRMALALSNVMVLSAWVDQNIYCISRVMRGIASLERIIDWSKSTELEPEAFKKTDPKITQWPSSGKIEGKNLTARYRPGLPRVLKGLDFVVNSKEKVGIVGRTGSGKSTLILSLLRIIE